MRNKQATVCLAESVMVKVSHRFGFETGIVSVVTKIDGEGDISVCYSTVSVFRNTRVQCQF